MTIFDSMINILSASNNTWGNPNWEYSGIKDVQPSIDGLSEKEKLEVLRKNHGRYAEWRSKEPGKEWRYIRLIEEPNGSVRCISNF